MKKIVRAVWISLLSGLAVLVACKCHNKTAKVEEQIEHDEMVAERLYGPPVLDPVKDSIVMRKAQLTRELDSINTIIERRANACVYGSPEVIQRYGEKTRELKAKAAEIQKQLDELK